MTRMRSVSVVAISAGLVLALAGCGGGETDPLPEGTAAPSASSAQHESSSAPAGWIGGEETTGLDWPAEWPAQFPRVGGEIIANNSDPDESVFAVVMYVESGVAAELIEALSAQGMTVISDDSVAPEGRAALTDGTWRVDVIGVIQDGTDLPHLRYMVQKDD